MDGFLNLLTLVAVVGGFIWLYGAVLCGETTARLLEYLERKIGKVKTAFILTFVFIPLFAVAFGSMIKLFF